MPVGACVVHQACIEKVEEIISIFESGVVKINCKDIGIDAEAWQAITGYCHCPAIYVDDPDGDYLLKAPTKYAGTESEPVVQVAPIHEPNAENVRGFMSDVKVWRTC